MTKLNEGQKFERFLVDFYGVENESHFPDADMSQKPDFVLPDGRTVQAKGPRGTVRVPASVATYYKTEEADRQTLDNEIYKACQWWMQNDLAEHFFLHVDGKLSTNNYEWVKLTRSQMENLLSTPAKSADMFSLTYDSRNRSPQLKMKSIKKLARTRFAKQIESVK
jgi:hypothetical protein